MLKKITSVLTLSLCLLVGCSKEKNIAYLDNSKIDNKNFNVEFKASVINEKLNIKINLENKLDKKQEIKFLNYKLTNEVSNTTYNVSSIKKVNEDNIVTLIDNKEVNFSFNEKLDYFNDEYYFSIKINKTAYRFNIYESNKENSNFYTVTYKVEDKEVYKEKRIKDSDVNYEWFSKDYVSYSSKWYHDEDLLNDVSNTYKLTSNKTFYGKKRNTLVYTTLFDNSYRVEKANYISNDKEVVIPKVYKNCPITKFLKETFNNIENKDTIERLYIGKNIIQIPQWR